MIFNIRAGSKKSKSKVLPKLEIPLIIINIPDLEGVNRGRKLFKRLGYSLNSIPNYNGPFYIRVADNESTHHGNMAYYDKETQYKHFNTIIEFKDMDKYA